MLSFFLLILFIEKSISVTTDELIEEIELRLVRQDIGFLKTENQNQNFEISTLKQMVESHDKTITQKIVKEVNQRMKDCAMTGDGNLPGMVPQQKQPFRIIPVLVDDVLSNLKNGSNRSSDTVAKSCRLLATVIYDASSKQSKSVAIPRKFYGQPTNCSDLSSMGYTLNGFYMVKPAVVNVDNAKLETIFCAFEQPEGIAFNSSSVEKRIAHLNLDNVRKSASGIHFHVLGNVSNLVAGKSTSDVIRFHSVLLNMGEAFDVTRGIFMAPKSGVYQFIFTLKMNEIPTNSTITSSPILLYLNKQGFLAKSFPMKEGMSMIEVTTKLNLADLIYVKIRLDGGLNNWASFSGSLLEEQD